MHSTCFLFNTVRLRQETGFLWLASVLVNINDLVKITHVHNTIRCDDKNVHELLHLHQKEALSGPKYLFIVLSPNHLQEDPQECLLTYQKPPSA